MVAHDKPVTGNVLCAMCYVRCATCDSVGRAVRTRPTSERRDARAHQNESAGVSGGGADEYATSDRPTRTMNSRLTVVVANPERRRSVRHAPEDPFCHGAKREATSGLPCTRVRRGATGVAYLWREALGNYADVLENRNRWLVRARPRYSAGSVSRRVRQCSVAIRG